jgi:predicted HTH domain antitoxin
MAVLKVEIEIPQSLLEILLGVLGISKQEFGQQASKWLVLGLFQGGKISSREAAEILDLSEAQFMALLNQRNLPLS